MLFKVYLNKILILLLLTLNINFAQTSISGGADFVSRYLWRGLDIGNTFSIQPLLQLSTGKLDVGFWGSYPFTNTAGGNEEMDLYLGYSIGNFSLLVTDYYFPNSGGKYGNYNNPGSHTVEVGFSYGASESFPVSLAAYMNVYNDEDNSVYFELGYSTAVRNVEVELFVGGTPGGDNGFYGTTEFNLINIGITATKNIKITDAFYLPVFSSFVLNPEQEVGYLLFGFSLGL